MEVKPRRGFYVRLFSIDELISIFEIREVLEGLAARRAACSIDEKQIKELREIFSGFTSAEKLKDYHAYSKADRRFHNFISEIASREFLNTILQTFNIISLAYQYANSEGLIREPDDTIEDHLKIIDAICDHDPDNAERLMREHLEKTITKLKTIVAQEQERVKEVNG